MLGRRPDCPREVIGPLGTTAVGKLEEERGGEREGEGKEEREAIQTRFNAPRAKT